MRKRLGVMLPKNEPAVSRTPSESNPAHGIRMETAAVTHAVAECACPERSATSDRRLPMAIHDIHDPLSPAPSAGTDGCPEKADGESQRGAAMPTSREK